MKIVGLDTSTWVGMGLSDGQEIKGKCINVGDLRGWQRVQLIAKNVQATLEVWSPEFAVIEDYAFNLGKGMVNGDTIVTQVSIGAMVRCSLQSLGIPWVEVRPSTLKKWTTGTGKADKHQMATAVRNNWGFVSPSDDIVDGVALAQFGQHLVQTDLRKLPVGVKHGYGKL